MRGDIFIDIDHNGIGDRIQFSPIPEAFYKWYGKKLVDINKCWVFDYNPYVQRRDNHESDQKLNFKGEGFASIYCNELDWVNPEIKGLNHNYFADDQNNKLLIHNLYPSYKETFLGSNRNTWFLLKLGIIPFQKPELDLPRGPRLYKYEEPNNVKKDQIAIHVGPSVNNPNELIPDYVLNTIKERYSEYQIVQIGSKNDNESPFIDKRGLPIWDSIKTIAESSIFIGINSGPMNIANCFPHINKKLIILPHMNQQDLVHRFEPLNARIKFEFGWVDYGWQYYIAEERDIGRMYSYKRI